jgi:hypothetical protein
LENFVDAAPPLLGNAKQPDSIKSELQEQMLTEQIKNFKKAKQKRSERSRPYAYQSSMTATIDYPLSGLKGYLVPEVQQ